MTNIWEFLLQTLTVSLTAAVLLMVKAIFTDKLSPRWQYGVWSLLALRALLPVDVARNIIFPLPVWLEALKARAEAGLDSAYTEAFVTMDMEHVLPWLEEAPGSLTDWLFVAYVLGVLVFALRYLLSYVRLRSLLRKGTPVSGDAEEKIQNVCEKYHLRPRRAVALEGVTGPFVCGVLRPVLVLPAGADTDEKILLHELLHLRHFDALQSIFWCVLRCLHWCNPWLHYVFDRVGNDMESLCDQRVLERLEGEERREYGSILLAMANEKYARAPGTTSLSNGGENIRRRIEAIVRFKKYPKGMVLVSVCIVLVLASPLLVGAKADYEESDFRAQYSELDKMMAVTRIRRCGTMAGALDTYAKGLINENGLYLAMASPLNMQEHYYDTMVTWAEQSYTEKGDGLQSYSGAYHYPCGDELMYANGGYQVLNLDENGDGTYSAWLAILVDSYHSVLGEEYQTTSSGRNAERCYVAVPVKLWLEDGAWVLEESGERIVSTEYYEDLGYGEKQDIPPLYRYTAEGDTGVVTVESRVVYTVDNDIQSDSWFGSSTAFDSDPKPDAEFSGATEWAFVEYKCRDKESGPENTVSMRIKRLESLEEEVDFSDIPLFINGSGSRSDGFDWCGEAVYDGWEGIVQGCSTSSWPGQKELPSIPAGYRVQVLWDGKVVEDLTLSEEVEP